MLCIIDGCFSTVMTELNYYIKDYLLYSQNYLYGSLRKKDFQTLYWTVTCMRAGMLYLIFSAVFPAPKTLSGIE